MSHVVSVIGLHVTLERDAQPVYALRGVDLDVDSGEILGVVGESGSGKTVLGLSILRLLPESARTSGQVLIGSVDILTASEPERRQLRRNALGAVFQDPMTSLNPTMRIGRQIAEVCDSQSDVVRVLRSAGIPDPESRLRQFPHELSGGLRQRVMIGMALAGSPALVVADEPTTALDVTVQIRILDLIRRLRDETGCAFLFVTHDLAVAARIADRLVVLYAGLVVEDGPTDAVLAAPSHPYTVGLLRSRIDISSPRDRLLPTLAGEPPLASSLPPGCPFEPRCPLASPDCATSLPELAVSPTHSGRTACFRSEAVQEGGLTWGKDEVRQPASMGNEPCLSGRGLKKTFRTRGFRSTGPREVLRSVSLRIMTGEAVGLVGESGTGKTTLLRIVSGLEDADGGEMRLVDHPQMVFQDPGSSLTPWLTIGEQITERVRAGLGRRADSARMVDDALSLVGLPPHVAHAFPGDLSGGQRQRAAIARAVVVPPRLLLCDEPTSSLDAPVAASILNLLDRLRRELGIGLLLVTHDLAVAGYLCDRIAVMKSGEIVELLDPDHLEGAQHEYSRELLRAVPRIEAP